MGKLSQSTIIEQINEKIDPAQLIEKINYAPDKIQIVGTTLKCFCPIHKEKAFRSLIIDLKKKTFRCSLKGCKGFDGGTLVEFYSLHTGQPELKAAFSLAKLLNLPIDLDTIRNMSQNFLEEAQQAFLEREIEKAQSFATQALDVFPDNFEACILLAQILEELGNNVGAVKEYQEAADGFASLEDYARALEIYEQFLLTKEPRNDQFLRKTAALYENLGDKEKAIQYYLVIAGENESRSPGNFRAPAGSARPTGPRKGSSPLPWNRFRCGTGHRTLSCAFAWYGRYIAGYGGYWVQQGK